MSISTGYFKSQFYIGLSSDTKPTVAQEIGSRFVESDTGKIFHWSGSTWFEIEFIVQTLERGVIGGERNTTSVTNNYDSVRHECNRSVLSAGTTAKNIGTSGTQPIYLMGIYVSAALVGTLTITGLTAEDGVTAASYVLPVGFVGHFGFSNAGRCESGCTITKSSISDDAKIIVDWRPIT